MISIPEKCYEEKKHRGRKLVCEERGRRVIFLKPTGKAVEKIRVDGCVLKGGKACDYLVRDWNNRHEVQLISGPLCGLIY